MSDDHTLDELVVTALARCLDDETRAFNGAASFVPVVAFLLARATHAPRLLWAAASIGVDARPSEIPDSTLSGSLWEGASMLQSSPYDFWGRAFTGRLNTFCFRGAQIDAFGNVNNTVIGDYEAPRVRLPGGGGMSDLGGVIPRLLLWTTTHDRRTFVDRLDFRSGLGWGDGGDHRERLGLPGGPLACVTDLAVLDFHPVSRRMRLRSVHPGGTVDDVVDATGFDLVIEGDVPETRAPTAQEVALIRRLDPTGARRREFQRT
ncbi:CoA-transferase subunit beta [Baekduia soli]|uniref:CoA-transferase subunit beta n=1 Tax=Baekduia soli TaxID=496014 RepID=A0A5B8U8H3_9ACTN|nr:CoA-transferase [Baekduia soli]QEC49280.1 CoA-transferase subunit beta [Baekduia soli]